MSEYTLYARKSFLQNYPIYYLKSNQTNKIFIVKNTWADLSIIKDSFYSKDCYTTKVDLTIYSFVSYEEIKDLYNRLYVLEPLLENNKYAESPSEKEKVNEIINILLSILFDWE